MSELDQAVAPTPLDSTGAPSLSTENVVADGDGKLSAREAANALSGYRQKRDSPTEDITAAPPTDAATSETPRETSPADELPAEQAQSDSSYEESPIEAPRSWSKEERERFNSLPRETQEYLARRENERDTALRRGQNDNATERQTLEAERKAIAEMRQQYEQVLPVLMQQLQQQQMGEFGDIRTQADIDNLARNDWQRFAMFQAHQMKMQNLNQQIQQSYQQSQQEYSQKWSAFAKQQDELFARQATEMSNPEEAQRIATQAVDTLRNVGFSDSDLEQLWSGKANVSLRDHRLQLLIRDAARFRTAKAAVPAKKAAMPASKTLRPGSPQERASDAQVNIDSLNKNLDASGKWKDGAALLAARRAARRR